LKENPYICRNKLKQETMKVYFSECVLLNREDENFKLIQKWLYEMCDESDWNGYAGGYMVECDSIFYNDGEGRVSIDGELWSFDIEGLFDESHLEMWGFEDYSEIPAGYIYEIV
jgi:hypothetical protein